MPDTHLTSSNYSTYGDVSFRIDDQKLGAWSMTASDNRRALGLWNGRGIGQIKRLIEGQTLQAWITPYSENEIHLTFNISGIGEALVDVRENCGW